MVLMTNTSIFPPSPLPTSTGYDLSAVENPPPKIKPTIYDWLKDVNAEKNNKKSLLLERIGKKVDKSTFANGLYGGLDGWSSSYSMVKYFFDLSYSDAPGASSSHSSHLMHTWMLTPEGIATTATWSTFVIALSIFGNIFEKKDPEKYKKILPTFNPTFALL